MLRIIQNRSAESAKSYYSRAGYYGEGQEKPGVWGGKTAARLGLHGEIRECDFQALCENRDPRNGSQLTARQNTDRTVGYDFNWHVPKGVTLAYAVGGDSRIETVFERAVSETMEEIEQEAMTRVRTDGRNQNRTTGNLVWGRFVHTTTRPDDKREVDPHLHVHAFVFNVTHDDVENRYKAAQFRELKRNAPWFEARMHARLAKYLREELGYSIKRDGRSWDIDGISPSTKTKFSRRTAEIEKIAEERDLSLEEKAKLGAKTRNSKSNHESFASLQAGWRDRLDQDETRAITTLIHPSGIGQVNGPRTSAEAVRNALSHCFEREAVLPERSVLADALRRGVGTIDVHRVEREARAQGLMVRDVSGRRLATTQEVLTDEARVLQFARDGRDANRPLNAAWKPTDDWLSPEQTNAIRLLSRSTDRLQLLLGGAGTGKTTLMQQAVASIKAGGHEVFTFAPSAEASRKVLRDEGFATATTVAELLLNEKLQDQTRGQVIWIDEASLLGSRQLKLVCDLAERVNARLILSGDWKRQHGSVERGGVLGLIDRYTPITPIQINTIRRQQGAYKSAIASMAAGNIGRGFDQLDELGWVREFSDPEELDRQLARDYADAVTAGRSAIVVSPTHRQAAHLTDAIRETLRARGRIKSTDREVYTLIPRHLTAGERSDPAYLREGDVLIFHQNAKGYHKGQRLVVSGTVPRSVTEQAGRFSVYRPSSLGLASGDKIRLTAGGKTKDGQHRLNNGSVFEIKRIEANGDLKLTNGKVIDGSFGHISHGFVTTSHASQGRTVDHVFIAESAESFPAASREQLYVSASRGRKSAKIYTDSKEDLRDVIRQSSATATASEILWPVADHDRHLRQQREATYKPASKTQIRERSHE